MRPRRFARDHVVSVHWRPRIEQNLAQAVDPRPRQENGGALRCFQLRFEGGAYDGYTFEVPDTPYKGLDVAYKDGVLRYGFDRTEGEVAVYVLSAELAKPFRPYDQIDLQANIRATALRFYPPRR
jgi:hypothetical protein